MTTFRAEIKRSFDVAPGDDAQKYFENLSADPTTTSGEAVQANTATGVVTIPMTNILGVVESST